MVASLTNANYTAGNATGTLVIAAPAGANTNVALAANGGVVTFSSQESQYLGSYANDGERLGFISGHYSFWRDATANALARLVANRFQRQQDN